MPSQLVQLLADHLHGQTEERIISNLLQDLAQSIIAPACLPAQSSDGPVGDFTAILSSQYSKAKAISILQPVCAAACVKLVHHASQSKNSEAGHPPFLLQSGNVCSTTEACTLQENGHSLAPANISSPQAAKHFDQRSVQQLSQGSSGHPVKESGNNSSQVKSLVEQQFLSPDQHRQPVEQRSIPLTGDTHVHNFQRSSGSSSSGGRSQRGSQHSAQSPLTTLTEASSRLASLISHVRTQALQSVTQLTEMSSAYQENKSSRLGSLSPALSGETSPDASQHMLRQISQVHTLDIGVPDGKNSAADTSRDSSLEASLQSSFSSVALDDKAMHAPGRSHLGPDSRSPQACERQPASNTALHRRARETAASPPIAQHLSISADFCIARSAAGPGSPQQAVNSSRCPQEQQQPVLPSCKERFSPKENMLHAPRPHGSTFEGFRMSAGPAPTTRKKRSLQTVWGVCCKRPHSCPPHIPLSMRQTNPGSHASTSELQRQPQNDTCRQVIAFPTGSPKPAADCTAGPVGLPQSAQAGAISDSLDLVRKHPAGHCSRHGVHPSIAQQQAQPTGLAKQAMPRLSECQRQVQSVPVPQQQPHDIAAPLQTLLRPSIIDLTPASLTRPKASPALPRTKLLGPCLTHGPWADHQQQDKMSPSIVNLTPASFEEDMASPEQSTTKLVGPGLTHGHLPGYQQQDTMRPSIIDLTPAWSKATTASPELPRIALLGPCLTHGPLADLQQEHACMRPGFIDLAPASSEEIMGSPERSRTKLLGPCLTHGPLTDPQQQDTMSPSIIDLTTAWSKECMESPEQHIQPCTIARRSCPCHPSISSPSPPSSRVPEQSLPQGPLLGCHQKAPGREPRLITSCAPGEGQALEQTVDSCADPALSPNDGGTAAGHANFSGGLLRHRHKQTSNVSQNGLDDLSRGCMSDFEKCIISRLIGATL